VDVLRNDDFIWRAALKMREEIAAPFHGRTTHLLMKLLLVLLLLYSTYPVAVAAFGGGFSSLLPLSSSTLKLTTSRSAMPTSGGSRTNNNVGIFAVLRALPRGGGDEEDGVQEVGLPSLDSSINSNNDSLRRTNDNELATLGGRSKKSSSTVLTTTTTTTTTTTKTAMLLPSSTSLLFVNFGRMYVNQLVLHPILTKSITAGIIFGLSDLCAQSIENNGNDVDSSSSSNSTTIVSYSRILTSLLVGLLFFGPGAHYWYSFIFTILPSTTLLSTIQKAILGQLIFGPLFTCIFFAAGLLQSSSFTFTSWIQKVIVDLPSVWVKGLSYWPIVDIISFMFVPVRWIPLFVNIASFIWTIYLSSVTNTAAANKA
jgi:hypothetical protein